MRVLPCLWLISPSLSRWRLSRPALLMLLSIVPAADSILPARPIGNQWAQADLQHFLRFCLTRSLETGFATPLNLSYGLVYAQAVGSDPHTACCNANGRATVTI